MDKSFFTLNRERFSQKLEDNSIAVFFSGKAPRESADQKYYFCVDKNFYYLTGIDCEDMVLTISKISGRVTEELYIPPVDEYYEKWYGILLRKEQAIQISGITRILDSDKFIDQFASKISSSERPDNVYIYSHITEPNESYDDYKRLASWLRRQFPTINIKNYLDIMIELRSTKTEEEVDEIIKAIEYTDSALEYVQKNLRPGRFEYQIRADYEYQIALRGSRPSFATVAASGVNATILHYNTSKNILQDNSLILLDVGATSNNYSSDITRTYPVNGKFTQRQKDIYNIVLEAQDVAMEKMFVGQSEIEVNNAVKSYFSKSLKIIKLINDDLEVDKYFYHGIGHSLGLDTHDYRRRDRIISKDSVYTVEPGLYIRDEGIGIRIEENVWVREGGLINLSQNVKKTVEDIENFMK